MLATQHQEVGPGRVLVVDDDQRLRDTVTRMLSAEGRRGEASPTAADTPLARSLQGTLDIQVKRLESLTKARSTQEVIEAELDRIEQQVRLLREESAVTSGPEGMSSRLDAITATLGETSKWMDQNAEILGSISMEEADGPSMSLPRIPEHAQPATPPPTPPRRRQQQ